LAGALGLPGLAVDLARWGLAVVLIALASTFVYWAAPNLDLRFKWVTPGSALFTAGWLAVTWLFAYYVRSLGSYNATYGALGGAVVLLIWFFLTGYILVLGAELNAVIDEQLDPAGLRGGRRRKAAEAASARQASG
jgi:membrane protein